MGSRIVQAFRLRISLEELLTEKFSVGTCNPKFASFCRLCAIHSERQATSETSLMMKLISELAETIESNNLAGKGAHWRPFVNIYRR